MNLKVILLYFCAIVLLFTQNITAQHSSQKSSHLNKINQTSEELTLLQYNNIRSYFNAAYLAYPSIPRGMLEAVAFQYSRFQKHSYDNVPEENHEHSMPQLHTIMGYIIDGKGVFRENIRYVSKLSGIDTEEILSVDGMDIKAYAAAFYKLQQNYDCFSDTVENYKQILIDLCELPLPENIDADFAINSFLYVIYYFLDSENCVKYGIPRRDINFVKLFGANLQNLRSNEVIIDAFGSTHVSTSINSDYPGAIYVPAASCNYSSGRNGAAISSVTIHYTQGTYAGSIAWFQNCASSVSAHYIIRSVDGQITQMVKECDKAWHVGSANGYTIGIEHEALGNIVSYFTSAMYLASANLVTDICTRQALNTHRVFYRDTLDSGTVLNNGVHSLGGATACTQIRGHQHYPNQTHTDPGKDWNWNLYYKLLNQDTPTTTYTSESGIFTDSGGASTNYGNDERKIYHIHIANADSIVLTFSEFELEQDYDFMWIYDGDDVFAPLIGRWNTQSPERVVAYGESMTIEFRSDCATTASGWQATWQSYVSGNNVEGPDEDHEELADDNDEPPFDNNNPQTQININDNDWITKDFVVQFSDQDDIGLKWKFYQIIESTGSYWYANFQNGFICDNFDHTLNSNLWINNNINPWKIIDGALVQPQSNVGLSPIAAVINGQAHSAYLYDFYLKFNSNGKCSFYFNCGNAPSITQYFSGYEIEFDQTNSTISVYRLILGAKRLIKKKQNVTISKGTNYLYRVVFDCATGEILLKRHATKILKITDGVLATTENSYIGFATNNSSVSVDNLRVYGARESAIPISVGAGSFCKIQTQAVNSISRTKLKSVVIDRAYKFSTLAEKKLKVDYTPPIAIADLNISTSSVSTNDGTQIAYLSADWSASSDINSGIAGYYYSKYLPDIYFGQGWTYNGNYLYCHHCYTVSNKIEISVIAENNAGLRSYPKNVAMMNLDITQTTKLNELARVRLIGTKLTIQIRNDEKNNIFKPNKYLYNIYDMMGRCVKRGTFHEETFIDLSGYANGVYIVNVQSPSGNKFSRKVVKTSY